MREDKASFHWLVPDENQPQQGQLIWAWAPETLAASHLYKEAAHSDVNGGKNKVNHWSLGIQLVNAQTTADTFSDSQVAVTAKIVR